MNIEGLRRDLRQQWLGYYQEHRSWLTKLGIWVNYDGQRRPSSSFILATLSILEPALTELLPLVVDLSQDPDQIVEALGLNFDPDEALNYAIAGGTEALDSGSRYLPSSDAPVAAPAATLPSRAEPMMTATRSTAPTAMQRPVVHKPTESPAIATPAATPASDSPTRMAVPTPPPTPAAPKVVDPPAPAPVRATTPQADQIAPPFSTPVDKPLGSPRSPHRDTEDRCQGARAVDPDVDRQAWRE